MEIENDDLKSYPVEDLTDKDNSEILSLISQEAKNGHVLHGTNSEVLFDLLETRQANDAAKKSGNQNAVYATDSVKEALFNACMNKKKLRERFNSYTFGWSVTGEENITLHADPDLYKFVMENYEECFGDGVLYVLNKEDFTHAEDAKHEYHSLTSVKPIKAFKVPGLKLARDIFPKSVIFKYSEEEIKDIRTHIDKMKK